MTNQFSQETWKRIPFDFEFTNVNFLEVSSFGRIRTFNKTSNGNIIKGSMINGYRIVRLKFLKARSSSFADQLLYLQNQVLKLSQEIKLMQTNNASVEKIAETISVLEKMKKNISKKIYEDTKKRTIHYHSLIHRLVAEQFLTKPSEQHTIVGHLDHDKLNNNFFNLQWMTPQENYAHQQENPNVIAKKSDRKYGHVRTAASYKLTLTRVMFLKKLLREGKPVRSLAKQFKITETQVLRIKKGENWAEVEAAK